jgi:hypothetical protein
MITNRVAITKGATLQEDMPQVDAKRSLYLDVDDVHVQAITYWAGLTILKIEFYVMLGFVLVHKHTVPHYCDEMKICNRLYKLYKPKK